MKRFGLLLVMLLCTAFVAAGCGDDEEEPGGGGAASPAATATAEASPPATDEGGGGGGEAEPPAGDPAVQAAIEACKSSINAQPQLSDDVKSDLEGVCEKAASGDEQAVRDATKEVCIKIIEETVPDKAAADQAKTACEAASGG